MDNILKSKYYLLKQCRVTLSFDYLGVRWPQVLSPKLFSKGIGGKMDAELNYK